MENTSVRNGNYDQWTKKNWKSDGVKTVLIDIDTKYRGNNSVARVTETLMSRHRASLIVPVTL